MNISKLIDLATEAVSAHLSTLKVVIEHAERYEREEVGDLFILNHDEYFAVSHSMSLLRFAVKALPESLSDRPIDDDGNLLEYVNRQYPHLFKEGKSYDEDMCSSDLFNLDKAESAAIKMHTAIYAIWREMQEAVDKFGLTKPAD